MKTLVVLFIILGIVFLYFVVNAEKSLIIKNDEVTPNGVNIPEFIANKIKEISKGGIAGGNLASDNLGSSGFINNAVNGIKDLVSKTVDKVNESIKNPIENKIQEIICPAK